MNISGFTIDALLILILGYHVLLGSSKGFGRIAITLIFSILGLIIAKSLSAPAGQWLTDNFIHEDLVEYFTDILRQNVLKGTDAAIAELPAYLVTTANNAGFSFKSIIGNSFTSSQVNALALKLATATETMLKPIITGIGYAVVFIAVKLVSSISAGIFSLVFKLPILKQVNKTLGLILGALKGLIIVLILSSLFMLVQNILPSSDYAQAIASSTLVQSFGGILTGIIVD